MVNSTVLGFYLVGNVLYMTGDFVAVSGQVRNSIAAFDATSGHLSAWDANLQPTDAPIGSVSSNGGLIFVGGEFSGAAGQPVQNLAALTAYTEGIFQSAFECVPAPPVFCQ
jgi:trimeric autotransporter adhesin